MKRNRPKAKTPRGTVQIRVSEAEKAWLTRLARKRGCTITQLLLSGVTEAKK